MYTAKHFDRLLGIKGFSEEMIDNHITLYKGYVKATNEALATLAEMRMNVAADAQTLADVRRRLGWEFNGMRLHEYYFENLGGNGRLDGKGRLGSKLAETFGSVELWEKDFRATGAMRGVGWAILYQDPLAGKFLNMWVNEHDVGHPAGAKPLLVLDAFEHAYMLDYGLKKDGYLDAFFANVDWKCVESRLA